MRSFVIRSLIVVAVAAGSASPAQAFGWEWLEELSGPGPWFGLTYEQKLRCWFDSDSSAATPASDDNKTKDQSVGVSGPCLNAVPDKPRFWSTRRAAVGLGGSFFWTLDNDLPYESNDGSRRIFMVQVAPFVDVRLWSKSAKGPGRVMRAIHGGVSAGGAWFFHGPVPKPFFVPVVEGRLSFKILPTLVKDTSTADIRVGVKWFLSEMTARDFGAVGDFRAKNEPVVYVGFVLDYN